MPNKQQRTMWVSSQLGLRDAWACRCTTVGLSTFRTLCLSLCLVSVSLPLSLSLSLCTHAHVCSNLPLEYCTQTTAKDHVGQFTPGASWACMMHGPADAQQRVSAHFAAPAPITANNSKAIPACLQDADSDWLPPHPALWVCSALRRYCLFLFVCVRLCCLATHQ